MDPRPMRAMLKGTVIAGLFCVFVRYARPMTRLAFWIALGVWMPLSEAWAQVWVAPRRAGQTIVRYANHDWQTIDLLVDEAFEGHASKAGGVRLFFYEAERQAAERAAAQLEGAYRELVTKFDFVPPKRFDYIVYGSYQEFLRTNLFPVQEGVLGATAPRGLEVALPYFGDHESFDHTSTHELGHEFTIQKVRAAARPANLWGDPLESLPLWFIEGLAEYVSLGPIDGENAMRVRDLVTNPDLFRGHGLLGFYTDFPGYVLWTYAGGHARVSFLEATYGAGTVNRILDLTPAILSRAGTARRIDRFAKLVEEVTGDNEARIAARFEAWIKRRSYVEFLDRSQSIADFDPLDRVVGIPLALDASPDGSLLAYRAISTDNGRTGLYLVDPRRPGATRRLVADRKPGVESLHPIDPRNFDLGDDRIAYIAERRGRDELIVQAIRHQAAEQEPLPFDTDDPASEIEVFDLPRTADQPNTWWRVRIRKGDRERLVLGRYGILAATSVALEPNGRRVAVVGLARSGARDIWIVDLGGPRPKVRQLTDDVFAERDVAWGPDGLVYSSDASADGKLQLFALDPDAERPKPRRLTDRARSHHSPTILADGSIVYSAYDDGAVQLFHLDQDQSRRLTDLPTGAFDPQPGGEDAVWTLVQHSGRLTPARLPNLKQITRPDTGASGASGPPVAFPTRELDDAKPYRAASLRNWQLDGGFAAIGAGPGGIFGQLYLSASDRLRDHAFVLSAQAYGTPELTDVLALYLNQHARISWAAGPFHQLRFRVDQSVDTDTFFQSGERFYGGQLSLRYPLDRFMYLQTDLALGGVSYFLFDDGAFLISPITTNLDDDLRSRWTEANTFPRFQAEATGRFGIDTTRYHPKTGPVAGASVLLEGSIGSQPFNGEMYGSARLDLQQYLPLPLISGANLSLRASGGTSGLGTYARGFWLSSYDTLRAYQWGDPALLGRHYWFGNAELQVPLDALLRVALASGIEGVGGLDFGGVADDVGSLWDRRVLDVAVGSNVLVGPLVLRLHWARAIDIGAPLPETRRPWVTNFSISWLGQ
ncbi:MAG: tolB protein precursor protein [Myxococcota bacterium]